MNKNTQGFTWQMALPLALLSVLAVGTGSAWSEPAQIPLTSRSAPPPAPNVMMTIDDSGSMLSDAMPEGPFTFDNGTTKYTLGVMGTNQNTYWIAGFPGDPRKTSTNFQDGTVTGLTTNPTVFQMQYRSPQINSIWYDPAVTYLPWISSDGVTRMAASDYTKAKWDPVIATGFLNLQGSATTINTKWCTSATSCPSSNKLFNPGLYYILTGSDPTAKASYVEFNLNDSTRTSYPKADTRTDCGDTTVTACTAAQERQNFANWFTYYRMRESLTKAAVSETFAAFVGKIRAGWGQINASNAKLDASNVVQQGIKQLDASYASSLISNVQKIASKPSTPLRTAIDSVGKYFEKTDANSPWLTTPGVAGSGQLACRRSVNVLMTDGYYNDTYSSSNVDGTDGANDYSGSNNPLGYSPTKYIAQKPYKDNYTSTLADVAMKYFVKDLQTGIDNKVPAVDGDIAFWQHLTQFTVGLGVRGTLDSSSPQQKLATVAALKAGTTAWPDPATSNPGKIDDMWHAAVNTGGDFYSVRNVSELTTALYDAFGRAAGAEAKEAGVAVTSNTVLAGQLKLVPKYKSASWNGDLEADTLNADGTVSAVAWLASEHMPKPASRNLYTWSGTAAVSFDDTLTSPTLGLVGSATPSLTSGFSLVNYVRGDDSNEGVGKPYRARGGKILGDFVNSAPVYVKDLVDLGYSAIEGSYGSYVQSKKNRSTGLVFQGGNAGVLHAFDSVTGVERFGFLPRAGLKNLGMFAAKDYGTPSNYHRFFVDGPLIETDAYIATKRNATEHWANILIGSMGAGGKSVFALNVDTTDPTLLDEKTVMWERSSADSGWGDLGYVTSQIEVGKIKGGSGEWRAFIGNGADSASGHAALLLVDLTDGSVKETLTVDSTSGNGLMGVTLIKDPTTQEVLGAYAGDLKGNLWRFDFINGTHVVGFGGKPLVTVANASQQAQPITVAPVVIPAIDVAGSLVLFGTGKLLTTADADNTDVQSFYAVLDKTLVGLSSAATTSPFNNLVARDVLAPRYTSTTPSVTATSGKPYYSVTGAPINWTTQLGWYMDLPFPRQRNVYAAMVLMDEFLFMQSIVPAGAASDCGVSEGDGFNYLLEARSGNQLSTPTYDTNENGDIGVTDTAVAGVSARADGVDKVICGADGHCTDESAHGKESFVLPIKCVVTATQSCCVVTATETCSEEPLAPPPSTFKPKDRIWRQIVVPPTP